MPSDTMPALGRPFTLGMFYDGRRDALLPGSTLWDKATIEAHTSQSAQYSSGFQVTASESMRDKSFLLDIDGSLEVSYMCGMVSVKGSAKYLDDRKKSFHQSRITCQYKATTVFKELMWHALRRDLDTRGLDVAKSGATHMVTGIQYGASAFFVFDSQKLDSASLQKVQGSMQAVINRMPSYNVDGALDVQLSSEEKAVTEQFTCRFHGDFILENNPATFQQAVQAYVTLPSLLGHNRENGVPVKVWMTPLKAFVPDAAQVLNRVSEDLLTNTRGALEDLQNVQTVCSDLLQEPVVLAFPNMQRKLEKFQRLCKDFQCSVERTLAGSLPAFRAGDEDESAVMRAFGYREGSPFSRDKLAQWLEHAKTEINKVKSCLDMMEGVKLVSDQAQMEGEVLRPGAKDVLCFVFTSLGLADGHLRQMSEHLDRPRAPGVSADIRPSADCWCCSDGVFAGMTAKARHLRHLADILGGSAQFRFLVAAVDNGRHRGASVYHYRRHQLLTENFMWPEIPCVEDVTDRRDLLWFACKLTLDEDTASSVLALSEDGREATKREEPLERPDLPQRFDPAPQVLSKQLLSRRSYWEAELSTSRHSRAAVAVCYGTMSRQGDGRASVMGQNTQSWSVGHRWEPELGFYAEHNAQSRHYATPPAGASRLGVYLDWEEGTLSFYLVSQDVVRHLHTFRSEFTEPLYVGFALRGQGDYARLCL